VEAALGGCACDWPFSASLRLRIAGLRWRFICIAA
jgi:hypothetical protein